MTKEVRRFEVEDEVVAVYPGIAKIPGEIFMTPRGNSVSDRYGIIDEDGDKHIVKADNLVKKGCNHQLMYHDKKNLKFCPFCDDI